MDVILVLSVSIKIRIGLQVYIIDDWIIKKVYTSQTWRAAMREALLLPSVSLPRASRCHPDVGITVASPSVGVCIWEVSIAIPHCVNTKK